jgi:vacuolar-type H+-ATPase catalytic subunit A/Vma1
MFSYFDAKNLIPILHKKGKSANETDLIYIGKKMKELLNQTDNINDISHVIIENQISPIANRMKTIQGMLAQYFIMKNDDIHIEFISSANKLKQLNKIPLSNSEIQNTIREPDTEIKQNAVYKQHKIDGVTLCSRFLDINPSFQSWKHVLDTKKKDDLADCFLQGIWYIDKKFSNNQ